MFYAPMVDLALTPEDIKEQQGEMCAPAVASGKYSGPKYPYGLCIRLEDETLAKLKLDGDLPSPGELVQFCATAKVTSASENERETSDGKTEKRCCVELQITEMAISPGDAAIAAAEATAARRKRIFPTMAADTDDGE